MNTPLPTARQLAYGARVAESMRSSIWVTFSNGWFSYRGGRRRPEGAWILMGWTP